MLNCFDTKPPVRKDPAVHVYLSSDLLVKQPGGQGPPKLTGETGEASKKSLELRLPATTGRLFHCNSEVFQRRAIEPLSSVQRADGSYIG